MSDLRKGRAKKNWARLALLACVCLLVHAEAASGTLEGAIPAAPAKVFVKVGSTKAPVVEQLLRDCGAKISKAFPQIGWAVVEVSSATSIEELEQRLQQSHSVFKCERNAPLRMKAESVSVMGAFLQSPKGTIDFEDVVDLVGITRLRSSGIQISGNPVVAVLDTGISSASVRAGPRLLPGYSIYGGTTGDVHGHGTAVAERISTTLNRLGDGGRGKLLPVKVLDDRGEGTYAGLVEGIFWAVSSGAGVVNMAHPGFPWVAV